MLTASHLFVPGWGADPALYDHGLPAGWEALEPPGFRAGRGSFERYARWLAYEVRARRGPVVLGGHSMGGALSVAVAAEIPEHVGGLLLVAPAGLPLLKPMRRSVADFWAQVGRGRYPLRPAVRSAAQILGAPRSALALARRVHGLDLSTEMQRVRLHRIPSTVVGCVTDTLVTIRHCREAARLLGADYRELDLPGGHMWMLEAPPRLRAELGRVTFSLTHM
jgi:pimeloyl-ACP methyl ester carboxylesterase